MRLMPRGALDCAAANPPATVSASGMGERSGIPASGSAGRTGTSVRDLWVEATSVASKAIAPLLKAGDLVILETTVPARATEDVMAPILETSGLSARRDFHVAHCPETVLPGNMIYELAHNHRVVGGLTPEATEKARELYASFVRSEIVTTDATTAELVKLIENTYRDVNIALANEIALVAHRLGVDSREAIKIANKHPRVHIHHPGPGVGGHCIPIDPHYLAWKMRGLNYKTRFIDLAGELNTEMPMFWVRKLAEALNGQGKAVRGASVLVLGVAYKRDIDDIRESPALDIIRLLEGQGARVTYFDPHVPRFREDGQEFRSVELTPEAVAAADCVMIVTDHTAVDYRMIKRKAKLVVDTRNAIPKEV